MYLYILGIKFLSWITEELTPCFPLIIRCPQRRDGAIVLCVLLVYCCLKRKAVVSQDQDRHTILKYENAYRRHSLAHTGHFGTGNETATIFHVIQKITHISPQYPIFGYFSQLPSFQKDIGPCVTTGISV
jgi:hypothetical protein